MQDRFPMSDDEGEDEEEEEEDDDEEEEKDNDDDGSEEDDQENATVAAPAEGEEATGGESQTQQRLSHRRRCTTRRVKSNKRQHSPPVTEQRQPMNDTCDVKPVSRGSSKVPTHFKFLPQLLRMCAYLRSIYFIISVKCQAAQVKVNQFLIQWTLCEQAICFPIAWCRSLH